MEKIKKGDAVTRKSYGNDIIFLVKRIMKLANKKQIAILKGIDVRVEADAPIEDLKTVTKEELIKREKELEEKILFKTKREKLDRENRRKEVVYTGRILHLDGELLYENVA